MEQFYLQEATRQESGLKATRWQKFFYRMVHMKLWIARKIAGKDWPDDTW